MHVPAPAPPRLRRTVTIGMKPFTTGAKVIVHYGKLTEHREIARVFRDGSFRLLGGLHRFTPVADRAVRQDRQEIYCELEQAA